MTRSSSGTTAPDQPEVREEWERRKAERRQAGAKAFRDMLAILYLASCLEEVFSATQRPERHGKGAEVIPRPLLNYYHRLEAEPLYLLVVVPSSIALFISEMVRGRTEPRPSKVDRGGSIRKPS